ncbi:MULTISPECIES: restriction endonuclease subunit S [Bacteroidales]|jgi:type I restriction enzyme S subunit|uniref:Restriction endonuclease subunit S n=3 Tax=Bacteroidaceae TaxID=815 RepID=A0A414YAG9_PHOVU|nr:MULTISPECIES: restriction endonuclease subunit S [Bacteroidales]MCE9050994.1 restriction endonuclease subunit S [Bacteroides fragilis]QUT51302.1 Type I restriction modification DNA specificity domain protein [Parabacteroides merdae]RHH83133.1 restriction endonuclease subunit S [Phocaeicola vulgatus]CUO66109.1 type I restriction enzyme EcoAI protein [Bacteroides uniformis]
MDTKKLRQKILDLAIHGKLVPQDPNDEPASVLLERIKAEKERLIKEGKIKKSKKSTKASDTPHYEQVPFEVPGSWVWCTLGDLAFYKKGPFGSSLTKAMFVPKSNDTYKVYEQKNAIQKDNTLGSYFITKEKYDSLIGFAIQPYDIIVSCAGTIGETYVLPQNSQEGIINQALMLIRLYSREIEQFYLLYFDFILKEEAYKESKGTAIKNIPPFDVLKGFHIPLPPISEQQRILKEIEHWFSLIDIIERGKDDLQTTIKQAKSKILDLAIHGKLVPQDPNDEPASELLKRINPKAEVTCDNGHYPNIPFDIPRNWIWVELGKIGRWQSGSTPNRLNKAYYGGNIPWLKTGDLNDGYITHIPEYITEKALNETSVKLNPIGSVLIAMYGATIGKIGILTFAATTNQACCACDVFEGIEKEYLFYFLLSHKEEFIKLGGGGAQPNISKEKIVSTYIPLPPNAEQIRIIKTIHQLFDQLDIITESL